MPAEVLGDPAVTMRPLGISGDNRLVPRTALLRDGGQRRRGRQVLGKRDSHIDRRDSPLLHGLDEAFVSRVDLLAQSRPEAFLRDAFANEAPVITPKVALAIE